MVPVKTVKIIPEPKYPFKIEEVRAQKGKDIRLELKPLNEQEQSGYELIVENLKKTKGRYSDTIILKIDSKVKSELKIHVYGDILDKPIQKNKPDLKKAPRSPLIQPEILITPKDKSKLVTPTTATPPTKETSDSDVPEKSVTPDTDSNSKTVHPETPETPETATPVKNKPAAAD